MKINRSLSQNIWFHWACKSTNDDKNILPSAKQAENTYHGSSYSRKICSISFRYNFWLLAMETPSKSKSKLIYAAASPCYVASGQTIQKIPQTVPLLLCVDSLLRQRVYCADATNGRAENTVSYVPPPLLVPLLRLSPSCHNTIAHDNRK
jgi:hypothetical protein